MPGRGSTRARIAACFSTWAAGPTMYSTSGLRVLLVLFFGGIPSANAQLKWATLEQLVRPPPVRATPRATFFSSTKARSL